MVNHGLYIQKQMEEVYSCETKGDTDSSIINFRYFCSICALCCMR